MTASGEPGSLGPLFLSIGAMKAGTTWTARALRRNPALGFSLEKEPGYFYAETIEPKWLGLERRVTKAVNVYLKQTDRPRILPQRMDWIARYIRPGPVDDAWYLSIFPDDPTIRWRCDFSNLHALLSEETWRDIRRRASDLRVLYTLRDPLKRFWSHGRFQMIRNGRLQPDQVPDEEMMAWMANWVIDQGHGAYADVITRVHNALGTEALLLQVHEARFAAPQASLREIEAFLDVPAADYPKAVLQTSANVTGPPMDIPDRFRALTEDQVQHEIAALDRLGVAIPDAWTAR